VSEDFERSDRRDDERADRRQSDRRTDGVAVIAERRRGERRLFARRLIDVFRSFLGVSTRG